MWTSSKSGMNESVYYLGSHPFEKWIDGCETFSREDIFRRYTFNPDTNSVSINLPDLYHQRVSEEDIPKMNIEEYRDEKSLNRKYAVACHNCADLSQERILKSISVMKSKLMMQCLPYRVDRIKCKMSPMVKTNMINAYRRVNMYGKKTPFVACFDEYGRRLPDEIKIDTLRGMDIKIVDPDTYGNNYLVFEAVCLEEKENKVTYEDLPF